MLMQRLKIFCFRFFLVDYNVFSLLNNNISENFKRDEQFHFSILIVSF